MNSFFINPWPYPKSRSSPGWANTILAPLTTPVCLAGNWLIGQISSTPWPCTFPNHYIVRTFREHLQLFWFVEDCLTVSIALMSRKQHVVHVLISPPPPSPIHKKKNSDQHWRYVQKYEHLEARFITVTYHIKVFLLFAIDWLCSEYWGAINNATLNSKITELSRELESLRFSARLISFSRRSLRYSGAGKSSTWERMVDSATKVEEWKAELLFVDAEAKRIAAQKAQEDELRESRLSKQLALGEVEMNSKQ